VDIQGDYSFRVAIPIPPDGTLSRCISEPVSSKDHHLVLAAQSGCQIAFKQLWDLYSRRVYRTLLGVTNNPQDAEDALQDAFLRAFMALESFEGRSSFYSWLTRIAINSALGILRRRRSRPEASLDLDLQREDQGAPKEFRSLAPDPEQIYAEQEAREKLVQAMQRLPPEFRNALQTRITENCSVKELARRLSISESAAKSRLYRARIMLGSLTASTHRSKNSIAIF